MVPEVEQDLRKFSGFAVSGSAGTKCPKSDIGLIMAAGKDKGVALLLTAEEIALGKEMAGVHDRFVDEMRIIKDQAARQAEIQELQGAGPDVTMDGDGEEELEDEEEAPPKRPKRVRRKKVPGSVSPKVFRVFR
jgi:hypothetical protein